MKPSNAGRVFDDALGLLAGLVDGAVRQDIVRHLAGRRDGQRALVDLATAMRSHRWKLPARTLDLAGVVQTLDARTRADGFHALHDWDGLSGAFNADSIAVELVNLAVERRGTGEPDAAVLAILVDYYVLYLLGLLSLRVWDTPDPDAALDRLSSILASLQDRHGSGQVFVRAAETLILVATSHYEADDGAYGRLLARTRTLSAGHQRALALGHAASMGCHLRFGFEATYARNLGSMRDDNTADYPWLSYALVTVLAEYDRVSASGDPADRRDLADAVVNGLSPDPDAFLVDDTPRVPIDAAERRAIRDLVMAHRQTLLSDVARLRPGGEAYSPLSFFFNFCQNVLKGAVLDAVLWGEASPVALDDLLFSRSLGPAGDATRLGVVRTLVGYARRNPQRIRGQLMPVIVYDPHAGRRAHGAVVRAMG